MPYYIRTHKNGGGQMLVEVSRAEAKRHMQSNLLVHYSPVSGHEAHQWVKAGRPHGTGLFVKREPAGTWPYYKEVIRKAQPGF